WTFPLTVKKRDRPSGAQKRVWTPSLPGSSRDSSELKSRTKALNAPLVSIAVNARRVPSGDNANDCRLTPASNANPGGGTTANLAGFAIAAGSWRLVLSQSPPPITIKAAPATNG